MGVSSYPGFPIAITHSGKEQPRLSRRAVHSVLNWWIMVHCFGVIIEDIGLPNQVIRSHYGKGFSKQYVRDHLCLHIEPATNDVTDYGVNKAVDNLPQLRKKLANLRQLSLYQQDILESFVERGWHSPPYCQWQTHSRFEARSSPAARF